MLIAILEHRSEQELLSYWLTLEANIKTDIETQYEKAWKKWNLNENEEATGDLAQKLAQFLNYSGRFKDFTKSLMSIALRSTSPQTKLYSKRKNAFASYYNIIEMMRQLNCIMKMVLRESIRKPLSRSFRNIKQPRFVFLALNKYKHDR